MPSLEHMQKSMMQAIDKGPDFLLEGLFCGSRQAVLRGMKVHANTISHARLVALEDTFPITRRQMGEERFNALSRQYLEGPDVSSRPLARIGETFSHFLKAVEADRALVDLTAFEWEWLESCHASEAQALTLSDLAGLREAALLNIVLARHPAARLLHMDMQAHGWIGLAIPQACTLPVLITRPGLEVRFASASEEMAGIFARLTSSLSVCNILEGANEPDCNERLPSTDPLSALIALIEAGAVVRAG